MHVKESIEVVIDANETSEVVYLKADSAINIALSRITKIISKTVLALAIITTISKVTCAVRVDH